MQHRHLPSAQLGGPEFGSNPACGKGSGGITSRWGKHGAAHGLGNAVNHYSQVKYQVVVALFGDAVVEPHCSRDRRVMGYTRLPAHSLGMPLLPFGHKQELGKGTAGLFLLPLGEWGSLLTRGPQPCPQPVQGTKVTSKSWDCPGAVPSQGSSSCWAILGTRQAAGMGVPSAQAEGELSRELS